MVDNIEGSDYINASFVNVREGGREGGREGRAEERVVERREEIKEKTERCTCRQSTVNWQYFVLNKIGTE